MASHFQQENDHQGPSSLPSNLNSTSTYNYTGAHLPQNATPMTDLSTTCILINNVPLEHTHDDITTALRTRNLSNVSVMPNVMYGEENVDRNYALASVGSHDEIPPSVQLQTGFSHSPIISMFQEIAEAKFVFNQQLFTAELEGQLHSEGQRLSLKVSFPYGDTVVVTGSCSQIYKFRQYLTKLLAHSALTLWPPQYNTPIVPINTGNTIPENHTQAHGSQHVIPIEEPSPHAAQPHAALPHAPKEETGRSFTGLSRDVLLLMSKQVDTFKGMTFHPDEGRVEILANLSEEEQEQCIAKFQQSYQDITKNRQVKSGDLQVPSSFSPEQLVSLFEEFNEKYNQCHFSHDDKNQTIRIVSMSSRQYDQAKKLISDRLHGIGASKPSKESKQTTTPTSGKIANKMGSSVVLQLSKGRKITVKRGNIVEEEVDVIVNAANSQLHHAAGVAGALDKASHYELQKISDAHVRRYGSVPVGGATTTKGGGKLKCKRVVHAVGPMSSQSLSEFRAAELIFNAITNSLIEAEKFQATSVSFPALSTGIFAIKKDVAAGAIFQALMKYHYTNNKILKDIRIVILDEPTYTFFARHLIELKDAPKDNETGRPQSTPPTNTTDGSTTTTSSATWSTHTSTGSAWSTSTTSHTWSTHSSATGSHTWPYTATTTTTGSTTHHPPPGFSGSGSNVPVITSQPGSNFNIHYPPLPSTFSSTPPTNTNPLAITSGSTSGTENGSFFSPPKLQLLASSGAGTGNGTAPVYKQQLSDPTGTSSNGASGSQDDKFKTPPTTPPRSPTPTGDKSNDPAAASGGTASNKGETDNPGCPICLNKIATDPVYTTCCKQVFCRSCLYRALMHSCYCPTCKTALRPVEGNQPIDGTMDCKASPLSLPGYEKWGSITINYYIPSGTQGPEHPNPGTRYHGTTRTAYLPDNAEGQEVLGLLKRAFDARLIFTIGTSHTSGAHNAVVWNDIHHKTSIRGQPFGYPDPTYLQRVKEELKAKGIQ